VRVPVDHASATHRGPDLGRRTTRYRQSSFHENGAKWHQPWEWTAKSGLWRSRTISVELAELGDIGKDVIPGWRPRSIGKLYPLEQVSANPYSAK
jgi:hypothetical protein